MQTVPIIGGTGALGFGLALRWAKAGVPIVIGSRKQESADEAVRKAREKVPDGQIEGAVNPEAAKAGPIVVLTVPFRAQSENLTNLRDHLEPGQILVDATVPLAAAISGKATRLLGVPQGSAGEQIAKIDGLRPVNAGLLEAARLIEGLTPLLIGVNARHKTHAGIKFTGLR